MTTLASGSSVTFGLVVDQTFEMSFADGTTGTITVTGALGSPYRTTFGPAKKNNWTPFPLGLTGRVVVACTTGSVSYTIGASSFVTAATDAVTGNLVNVSMPDFAVSSNITLTSKVANVKFLFYPNCTLTLGDDAQLVDCEFDFSRITSSTHYPNQWIGINGDRVKILNCRAAAGAGLPYPYVFDSSTVGRFIEFTGDCNDVAIARNELLYGFYGVCSTSRTLNRIRIEENDIQSARLGVYIDDWQGSDFKVINNTFRTTPQTSPVTSLGEIKIVAGWVYMTTSGLTNTVYTSRYATTVDVSGNTIAATSHRAIWVVNCIGVAIERNTINFSATPGDDTGATTSDDVLIIELCRYFSVAGNKIYCSGENGVDILGSKNGVITGNVSSQCDALACSFDWSDAVKAGYSTGFSAINHLNENIASSGNSWDAGEAAIMVKGGRNLKFADKIGKFYNKRSGLGGYDFAIDCNATYTTKASGTWPEDIDFSGTTKMRIDSVLVNAWTSGNALNTDFEHGFNSGDRVNVWLETPTGGTMITGIDDITDYFVIRDSSTAFRLATSFANATAGSPTAISLSGSLVGNLYVGELQAGRMLVNTVPSFDIRGLKLSRDLAEVSTLTSVGATTNYIYSFSGVKGPRDNLLVSFGYLIRNAPSSFGSGSNSSVPRLWEFRSGFVTDTAVRGITVQWSDRTQIKYRTGADLLPVTNTDVAGTPGTGGNAITTGYVRAIIQ